MVVEAGGAPVNPAEVSERRPVAVGLIGGPDAGLWEILRLPPAASGDDWCPMSGFEPSTAYSQNRCSTRLS